MFPTRSVVAVVAILLACARTKADEDCRAEATEKGSLLIYPTVEIEWNAAGQVALDTVLQITNDYPRDVTVQFYFINGDAPVEAVFAGDPPSLVVDPEPGWNFVDCQFELTRDQTMTWSAARGSPGGCQPFTVLDPDGRSDPDGLTSRRVVRGYAMAWAVNADGEEIRWNHLSGNTTIIDYEQTAAWEHEVFAFAAKSPDHGLPPDARPGQLILNGREYDAGYDLLLFEFNATGSSHRVGGATVSADSDLTLLVVEADLRDEHFEPTTTLAVYDIWDMNEHRLSGTQHFVTCWFQRLLSGFGVPNHFLLSNLHTDRGKARIQGIALEDCTPRVLPASLLGTIRTKLAFSGSVVGDAATSAILIGMGCEEAAVLYDTPDSPPQETQAGDSPRMPRERPARLGERPKALQKAGPAGR